MSSTSTGPTDPLGSDAGSRGGSAAGSTAGSTTGSVAGSATGPSAEAAAGPSAEPVPAGGAADRSATPPLRCVVVTPYATLGGSERWLLALLDGAGSRLDAEVWLLEDGPLRAELERRDVATLVLPTGPDARALAARGADLARRLRDGDADVLLANGVKAAAAAVPAARLVGVPVVWAKHDFSFDSTLARPLGALADAVLATSAAVAAATGRDDAVLVPPPRPAREAASRLEAQAFWSAAGVPVPADTADTPDTPEGPGGPETGTAAGAGRRTLAMLTRLVAYKGVDTAIAALAEPAAAGWDLLVVGPDDPSEPGERARLEALAADLGVAGRVRLVPEVDEAGRWLAAVDAVAVLTRSAGAFGREGYSLVALEALAAGVPLLGGRGNPEVERMAAAAGRVVAAGDPATPDGARAVADVARGLAELGDPDVRRTTRPAAERLHAAHPDAATCTALTVGLLAETAGRPGAGLAPAEPVTVLTCFKDEAGHVDGVVARVVEQLGPDDEYLLVDDHSTDGTSEELAAWARREPRIRVLPGPGVNLSAARNHGFAHATHAVVACTDAGVEPATGWLDALRTPFAERLPAASPGAAAAAPTDAAGPVGPGAVVPTGRGVDLVVGVYEVDGGDPWRDAARLALFPAVAEARRRTPLVRVAGTLTGRRFDAARLDGRSMACTVEAWKRAGGFDESLYSSEDAVFGTAVRATGGRSVLALDACVTWAQSGRVGETAAMYRKYGEWGGRAGSWPLVSRDLVRGSAYLVAPALAVRGGATTRALLALGALGYLAVPLSRARAEHAAPATVALMPLALALKDVAKAVGCARGSLGRLRGGRA